MTSRSPSLTEKEYCHIQTPVQIFLKFGVWAVYLITKFGIVTQHSTSLISDKNDGNKPFNPEMTWIRKKCRFLSILTRWSWICAYLVHSITIDRYKLQQKRKWQVFTFSHCKSSTKCIGIVRVQKHHVLCLCACIYVCLCVCRAGMAKLLGSFQWNFPKTILYV